MITTPIFVALCPPGVRTVVVEGWANADDPDVTGSVVYPVVAVQAAITADGIEHAPVLVDADYGLVSLEHLRSATGVAHRVVACPWPEAEDAERLALVVAELKARASEDARKALDRKAQRQDPGRLRKPVPIGGGR